MTERLRRKKSHVENETIAEPLDDDNGEKTRDSVFCMALRDDRAGTDKHGDDVDNEENVRDSTREIPMLVQIPELVTPLCDNPKGILEESDDDEEATEGREVRPERLGINLDVVFDLLCIIAKLFDGVFWVCGSIARGGS